MHYELPGADRDTFVGVRCQVTAVRDSSDQPAPTTQILRGGAVVTRRQPDGVAASTPAALPTPGGPSPRERSPPIGMRPASPMAVRCDVVPDARVRAVCVPGERRRSRGSPSTPRSHVEQVTTQLCRGAAGHEAASEPRIHRSAASLAAVAGSHGHWDQLTDRLRRDRSLEATRMPVH
jgi:hypothetical protein